MKLLPVLASKFKKSSDQLVSIVDIMNEINELKKPFFLKKQLLLIHIISPSENDLSAI